MALIITGQNKDGLGVMRAYLIVSTAAAIKGFQLDDQFLNPKVATKYRAELSIFKDQPTRLQYQAAPILSALLEFNHEEGGYLPDEAYEQIKAYGIPGWTNLIVEDIQ
jgi:hypothetical protein